jgi:hypothetical protein
MLPALTPPDRVGQRRQQAGQPDPRNQWDGKAASPPSTRSRLVSGLLARCLLVRLLPGCVVLGLEPGQARVRGWRRVE